MEIRYDKKKCVRCGKIFYIASNESKETQGIHTCIPKWIKNRIRNNSNKDNTESNLHKKGCKCALCKKKKTKSHQ